MPGTAAHHDDTDADADVDADTHADDDAHAANDATAVAAAAAAAAVGDDGDEDDGVDDDDDDDGAGDDDDDDDNDDNDDDDDDCDNCKLCDQFLDVESLNVVMATAVAPSFERRAAELGKLGQRRLPPLSCQRRRLSSTRARRAPQWHDECSPPE